MNENTNTSTNQTAPKAFDIIDGNTLMAQEYEPLRFAVEKIRKRQIAPDKENILTIEKISS